MGEIAIRIQDPSATVARDIVVSAQDTNVVRDLVDALVDVMEWPRETFDGDSVSYRLRKLGRADALDEDAAVAQLDIARGDGLVLGPAEG